MVRRRDRAGGRRLGAWLLQPRGGLLQPKEPSIAVLPFTTLSDRSGDRYFAEGLAVEMHSALAGVHGLKVATWIPPDAVAGEDARTVGNRLGVATVLDASVRRDRDRVRISARLSDTRTGYTLWSQTYEHDVADVFATQSDIAQQVVSALVGVLPEGNEGLRRRLKPTQNVAAFDAYLKGLQSLVDGRSDDAIVSFRTALDSDSGFARAQAGICQAEIDRFEAMRGADAFENARLACLRAQKMDPTMATVKLALGDLYRVRSEFGKASEFYESARNDPETASNALVGLAEVASAQGDRDARDRAVRPGVESQSHQRLCVEHEGLGAVPGRRPAGGDRIVKARDQAAPRTIGPVGGAGLLPVDPRRYRRSGEIAGTLQRAGTQPRRDGEPGHAQVPGR